jgi:predicted metal-dependent hydrolase
MVPGALPKVRAADDLFAGGIDLFNRQEFFECHEALEDLWRPARGARRFFLQGVIHLAVGFYHHQQANRAGAERQLRKGLKKLAGYLPEFENVDTVLLYREALSCLEAISSGRSPEPFPQIRLRFAGWPQPAHR